MDEVENKNKIGNHCKYCGHEIDEDSIFCKHCGRRLSADNKSLMHNVSMFFKSMFNVIYAIISKISVCIQNIFPFFKNILKKIFRGKILLWITLSVCVIFILFFAYDKFYYYINYEKPRTEAQRNFKQEEFVLNNLKGEDLYKKCGFIIRENNIDFSGHPDIDEDYVISIKNLAWSKIKMLAEEGNLSAQFDLALLYDGYDYSSKSFNTEVEEDGSFQNPNIDFDKAAYWYLKCAMQGNAAAQNNLGCCYEHGRGVKQDIEEAVKWYRLSAKNGDDYGQLHLGDCFRDGHKKEIGEHWEKDPEKSYHEWVGKYGYIRVKDYKRVLEQNIDSAKYWWKKSAAQGNEDAKERLEKIY